MTDARDTMREVPVARVARERYAFDEPLLPPIEMPTAAASARRLARLIAERRDPAEPAPPRARQLQAMALIHEAMHRVIQAHGDDAGQTLLGEMLVKVGRDVGSDALEEALLAYAAQFPVLPVYRGELPAEEYLEERSGGRPHREVVLEELLLLWLANRNPAFIRHGDLFDELPVARTSLYPEVVESMRRHLASAGEPDEDLVGLLLSPALESPDSLAGQLRYIRDHWPEARALVDALGAYLDLLVDLERGVGVDDDDDGIATPAFGMGGPGETDTEALHGFAGLDSETERYSQDRDWMPRTVLMAKSTYVWLDQLSRRYERPIRTLDAIPDEELESLAAQGFTGLWLIGVWERSVASKLIKQRRGNPEAVASAYSLMDYRISEDLGGEAAFAALRERSMARGIRLACDMVPNHMGIDSRWVVEHPDFFISRPDSPFPAYSFSGPNLSTDERAGIYLEDHYDDGSDAAVVFRRVDRWSGEERYVYHGNDGTGMPWNDTAQLDYLREDVREAVIETILAVARRAPIIRFDAAMTLASRHVQRLWYPMPGSGESIASRAESAMDPREFAERMPVEFWRQVVDRVATEAPDTLLLAEAFWLMEGYFVRTLGMHRVYNSAFMHMLRDEDNAGYRTVIRNTLAFDPEILKRYVDFMSNPDERTAVDQFGDGDKYFGVATVLATLPGLPMFGHGQVEGFAERYGMEFRRARLEEHPNQGLVERHEREIFPLLHQRALFAEARDFALFDLVTADGSVNEDVYAYTNAADGRHSLVVYHNRYAEARGHIRACVPSMRPVDGGERASVSWTLAEALALPAEPGAFVVLRDIRSGMEWLHDCRALHELGLELDLRAYECRVFIDPVIRWDSPDGDLARLAWQLGGRPVPSVDEALDAMVSAPLRDGVAALIDAEAFRRIAGSALARDASAAAQMLTGEAALAADRMARLAEVDGHAGPQASVLAELDARLRALTALVRLGRGREAHPAAQRVGRWLGTDRARWATILGWMYADAARTLLEVAPVTEGWSQKRGVDAALHRAALGLGVSDEEAQRAVEVARGLLAAPDAPFASSDVRAATGWHPWEDAAYVQREAFEDFVDALIARDVTLAAARGEGPEALGVLMEVLEGWREAVGSAGWRVGSVDEEAG